jgi:hypothetical protein
MGGIYSRLNSHQQRAIPSQNRSPRRAAAAKFFVDLRQRDARLHGARSVVPGRMVRVLAPMAAVRRSTETQAARRLRISRRAYPKPPRRCSRSCRPTAWPSSHRRTVAAIRPRRFRGSVAARHHSKRNGGFEEGSPRSRLVPLHHSWEFVSAW